MFQSLVYRYPSFRRGQEPANPTLGHGIARALVLVRALVLRSLVRVRRAVPARGTLEGRSAGT